MAELFLENPAVRAGYDGRLPDRDADNSARKDRAASSSSIPAADVNLNHNRARPGAGGLALPPSSVTATYGTSSSAEDAARRPHAHPKWAIPSGEYYRRVKDFFTSMHD